jgi:hypothetical protein
LLDKHRHAGSELKKESKIPIELRFIEKTPHKACLRLKRESHILFDHLQGYFGVSSLEGLSQGLCVITGLDAWNRRHIEEFTGVRELSWVSMSPEKLLLQLKTLIQDNDPFEKYLISSRNFIKKFWNAKFIIQSTISTYSIDA